MGRSTVMEDGVEGVFAQRPPKTGLGSNSVGMRPAVSMDLEVVRPAGPAPGTYVIIRCWAPVL